ncbi:hypothetical protein B4135_2243 [Caldibacillus debilis]|uniref:Uncharacterized protein n=1 Tax=Caldibacillus debilis TaxID=301148 RepID=A0A150M2F9_9BACI|nr:hypothetical protein B4135_2243 [Caldibacillus debilis]
MGELFPRSFFMQEISLLGRNKRISLSVIIFFMQGKSLLGGTNRWN